MAEDLARLHTAGFAEGRPWSADEFTELLASPRTFLVTARDRAFALGRAMGREAELLTLVTHPDFRRLGLGAACLAGFEAEAQSRHADSAFLEVAEDNAGARALYGAAGYRGVGERPGYYPRETGAVSALVLSKRLTTRRLR